MPENKTTSYSVSALGSPTKKKLDKKIITLKVSAGQIISSVPLDVPCRVCGYANGVVVRRKMSAFAVKCGKCDSFQFFANDDQLEIIANSLPVGGCDE